MPVPEGLNKAHAREWVAALRSGEFKQGRDVLMSKQHNGTAELCCLGVACIKSGLRPVELNGTIRLGDERFELPLHTQKWLGVNKSNPEIGNIQLTSLNDLDGLTFAQIADRIEQEWELKEEVPA